MKSPSDTRCAAELKSSSNSIEMDIHPTSSETISFLHGHQASRSPSPIRNKIPRKLLAKADYTLGIALLFVVVFLWTASNFVTQDLFDVGYEKPFLVTYLNTGSFTLYLVPFLIRSLLNGQASPITPRGRRARAGDLGGYEPISTQDDEPNSSLDPPSPLTMEETAKLASMFCFFWFIANWSLNAALDYTSVASATILSSMSGFFTLGLGRLFKVEKLTASKIGAVVTSFVGVILVSVADSHVRQNSNVDSPISPRISRPVLGDFLALLSAGFYALYVILLKVRIKTESRINMQLFFGFVGLFNLLACWPVAILLHVLGVEPFELPGSGKVFTAIIINMAITLSSDYIYVIAMLKTTPLVVTVGLSMTIPLAVVGDFILRRPVQVQVILGAVLVVVSFIAVGLNSPNEKTDDTLDNHYIVTDTHPQARLAESLVLDGQDR